MRLTAKQEKQSVLDFLGGERIKSIAWHLERKQTDTGPVEEALRNYMLKNPPRKQYGDDIRKKLK